MRKQYARCIVLRLLGGFKIYTWLSNALETEFEPVRLIKESPRGSVQSIRHKATGQLYILRRFSGNAEVYARLLEYTCPNLPVIYEVAQQDGDNLVLEEFIQGDTLGFLLQDALFSPEETKKIVRQVCRRCGCCTPSAPCTGMSSRKTSSSAGTMPSSLTLMPPGSTSRKTPPTHRFWAPPGFAAPEQYGLSQSDIRTDIYALGVLINVMLTGEHPSRHLAKGRMGRIVDRCTHVNPQRRYKNVLRLMEAL